MVYSIAATTIRELGARHGLSNLSVYNLVEEFARHVSLCFALLTRPFLPANANVVSLISLSDLYKAGTSLVIDTLIVTPIEDDDNLLNTIDSHIKLRKLKEVMLLCWIIKLLSIPSVDKYSKKHLEVREADASKQRLELEAQLRKASEEEELAKTKKEKREKEAWEREARLDSLLDSDDYCLDSSLDIDPEDDSEDEESLRESRDSNRTLHSRRLIGAYILYFKELSSDNGRIFASVIGMTRTRAIVLLAIIGHVYFKN
ncbi:hypothetical protein HBI07_144370 [Parastagonospora nodorum]|nr:hypothetical protein HBI07_144370 [Parastagonospora nodorum]